MPCRRQGAPPIVREVSTCASRWRLPRASWPGARAGRGGAEATTRPTAPRCSPVSPTPPRYVSMAHGSRSPPARAYLAAVPPRCNASAATPSPTTPRVPKRCSAMVGYAWTRRPELSRAGGDLLRRLSAKRPPEPSQYSSGVQQPTRPPLGRVSLMGSSVEWV